jgi:hypothetical protein
LTKARGSNPKHRAASGHAAWEFQNVLLLPKGGNMKDPQMIRKLFPAVSLIGVLLLVPSVFAKGKNLTIYEKARLNSVTLEPGDYKVQVAENGGSAEVMIYKGRDLVAKAKAQLEKLERKAGRNTVRLSTEAGKAPRIIEIRLAGEAQALRIESSQQISQKSQ